MSNRCLLKIDRTHRSSPTCAGIVDSIFKLAIGLAWLGRRVTEAGIITAPVRFRLVCALFTGPLFSLFAGAIACAQAPSETNSTSNQALIENSVVVEDKRLTGVVESWTFERMDDIDYDGWPENWQREDGREYPAYLPIRIVPHDPQMLQVAQAVEAKLLLMWRDWHKRLTWLPALPPSLSDWLVGRYLRIDLNGGWAMLKSTKLPVDSLYRYRLEVEGMCEKLVEDHAWAELAFLDGADNVLLRYPTAMMDQSKKWHAMRSELASVPAGAVWMQVRLIIRPKKLSGEFDIYGAAGFDNVMIRRLPQMRVETDERLAVYSVGQQPEVTARVLGLGHRAANIHFELRDVNQKLVDQLDVSFVADNTSAGLTASEDDPDDLDTDPSSDSESEQLLGVAKWQLPKLPPGYYEVRSILGDPRHPTLSTDTSLAILSDLPTPQRPSVYGWTLPKLRPVDVDYKWLPDWLSRLGLGVVKYPCWFAPEETARLDEAAWFVGRLQEKNIRAIGLLDSPPPSVLSRINERERREAVAANLFRDAQVWQPMLEPLITRLSLKVRTWQLGADNDFSFLGRANLKKTLKDIARELQGYGQPLGVTISWPWLEPLPPVSEETWAATQLSASDPLSGDEVDAYLQSLEKIQKYRPENCETWVALDPLNAQLYDRDTRIADMVLRMVTVRAYPVTGAFVTNPIDRTQGLLRADWRPDQLLIPWRTTAMLLGDLTRIGSIPTRNESPNVVLADSQRTSMVIWNSKKTTEFLYLGDSIRQVDVWGNITVPRRSMVDGVVVHRIEVGPLPSFLIDLDPALVALRMSAKLTDKSIDSLLGIRQSVGLEFVNPTRETLSGEVRMKPIPDWDVDSRPQSFDLTPGRASLHNFDVALRNSAKIGNSQLQFEFLLKTSPPKRFTIIRDLHVGPDGLEIEVTSRQNGDQMIVTISITNQSDKAVQYDCMLFPPGGRQYQRRQIQIPPESTIKRVFPWDDAESLVGQKMLLRAMEQGGSRVLNQVITLTP